MWGLYRHDYVETQYFASPEMIYNQMSSETQSIASLQFSYLQIMKKLLLPFLLFFASGLYAQKIIRTEKVTDHSIHIIGDNFDGVIFTKEYNVGPFVEPNSTRFTPSINDIALIEKLLDRNLDTVGGRSSQNVAIHKNLKNYVRQYWGYITEKGEKIIYINALDNESNAAQGRRWLNDLIEVLDGGPAFWNIKVNLTNPQLFDFSVNGVG